MSIYPVRARVITQSSLSELESSPSLVGSDHPPPPQGDLNIQRGERNGGDYSRKYVYISVHLTLQVTVYCISLVYLFCYHDKKETWPFSFFLFFSSKREDKDKRVDLPYVPYFITNSVFSYHRIIRMRLMYRG